jgi:hypothetical protein
LTSQPCRCVGAPPRPRHCACGARRIVPCWDFPARWMRMPQPQNLRPLKTTPDTPNPALIATRRPSAPSLMRTAGLATRSSSRQPHPTPPTPRALTSSLRPLRQTTWSGCGMSGLGAACAASAATRTARCAV